MTKYAAAVGKKDCPSETKSRFRSLDLPSALFARQQLARIRFTGGRSGQSLTLTCSFFNLLYSIVIYNNNHFYKISFFFYTNTTSYRRLKSKSRRVLCEILLSPFDHTLHFDFVVLYIVRNTSIYFNCRFTLKIEK